MSADICGWCGFPPMGGDSQTHDGITFCHGPGVPRPTCWQQVTSEGRVIAVDFGERLRAVTDSDLDDPEEP